MVASAGVSSSFFNHPEDDQGGGNAHSGDSVDTDGADIMRSFDSSYDIGNSSECCF